MQAMNLHPNDNGAQALKPLYFLMAALMVVFSRLMVARVSSIISSKQVQVSLRSDPFLTSHRPSFPPLPPPQYGRKPAFVASIALLSCRCFFLSIFVSLINDTDHFTVRFLILLTSILDGWSIGIFETSLAQTFKDLCMEPHQRRDNIKMTTLVISLGTALSGYFGESITQKIGYAQIFTIMALLAAATTVFTHFFFKEPRQDR